MAQFKVSVKTEASTHSFLAIFERDLMLKRIFLIGIQSEST